MPKRKTRHQKKLADLRQKTLQLKPSTVSSHALSSDNKQSEQFAYSFTHTAQRASTKSTPLVAAYAYVQHDLIKTAMLSSAIILLQLLLFFLLQIHIVRLPNIQY